ncbi:predicted protein [Sclerotinia sclerotiorum 1980 UF-70]|uniref:Uncharacterized protein n=1 Tax=Sclerotinia sclerotiorum (strain ATCC 18683 / 1980 / Ss-1) TaxID=665079 RepID=A7F5K2_SCLS1|nr:predicted protein [Sclerotinia sclerotiorum 1980 UF-70]EDN98023.1 predicted protein [Sclerotinia sclerotiorum 1980 UF-70]
MPWTNVYSSILIPALRESTYDSVNRFLSLDQQYLSPNPTISALYAAEPSDYNRLERRIHPSNHFSRAYIQQEGDTVRDFFLQMAFPVSLAWDRDFFLEKSESGTPGPTDHKRLLIKVRVQFHAKVREGIKSEDCTVDVCCLLFAKCLYCEVRTLSASVAGLDTLNSYQSGEPCNLA